jgi:hypothetical protein
MTCFTSLLGEFPIATLSSTPIDIEREILRSCHQRLALFQLLTVNLAIVCVLLRATTITIIPNINEEAHTDQKEKDYS